MVAGKEEYLVMLVEEVQEQGVIDSVCLRTVAGVNWVKRKKLIKRGSR